MNKPLLFIIKQKIGLGVVFSIPDIAPYYDKSGDALKEELSRLGAKGSLKRIGYGLYLYPTGKETAESLALDALTYRYVKSKTDVYGFYYGEGFPMSLINRPYDVEHIEIVSNHVTSGKKVVYQFSKRITLRKPYLPVNKDNVAYLSLLTYLSQASKDDLKKNYPLLANFVREQHLSAITTSNLLPSLPAKTAQVLLSSGLYKIMWHH